MDIDLIGIRDITTLEIGICKRKQPHGIAAEDLGHLRNGKSTDQLGEIQCSILIEHTHSADHDGHHAHAQTQHIVTGQAAVGHHALSGADDELQYLLA